MITELLAKEMDEYQRAVDALIFANAWKVLNEMFEGWALKAWRMDKNVLFAIAFATVKFRERIPARIAFINRCKTLHPDLADWDRVE